MRRKGNKLLAVAMAVIAAASMMSGCGDKDTNTSASAQPNGGSTESGSKGSSAKGESSDVEPCTITYYGGWTGADLDKMQALVDEFNGSQDTIKVEFTSLQWSEIFTKFLADYQAGSSPDIVAMHTFEMGQFVDMGVLDADQVAAMDLQESDYVKTAWDGCKYEDTLYGVPIDLNMHALYYNEDMFKAAGIEKAPATGEELIDTAMKLTLDGSGKNATEDGFDKDNIKQYGFGFLQNHHTFYQVYSMLNQQEYNPFTVDMKDITLDTDKTAKAIQFIEDLVYKYNVTPVGEKSPIDDFKAGTVAMIIDGNWQLSGLNEVSFGWNTAEYPKIFDEKAVWGAAELLAFPASKNPDANKQAAARSFVKWLSENSAQWALSGQIPANIKAQEDSEKLKGIDAYYAEMDYVKFLPANPLSVSLFSSKAPSPILTMAQDATLNAKDPAEIIKQFEKDLNDVMKNN